MKRYIALFLASACIFMATGCSNVPVTYDSELSEPANGVEKVKADLIPMVMVKNEVYYDTGKESGIGARCGVMDGEITSMVDRTEIPAENGQSNFGTGYGYQFMAENQIEILMNNKWFVFEKRHGDGSTRNINVNSLAGVSLEIKEDTLSNKGLTVSVSNKSEQRLMFGSYYCVEKEIDGRWHQIPYIEQEHDVAWNDIGYEVPKGSSYEFDINWEWLYGALKAGEYRIIKNAVDYDNSTEYYFAVEFSLAE